MLPHRQQPTRLPHPWDSPGKNTGAGCHFLLHELDARWDETLGALGEGEYILHKKVAVIDGIISPDASFPHCDVMYPQACHVIDDVSLSML